MRTRTIDVSYTSRAGAVVTADSAKPGVLPSEFTVPAGTNLDTLQLWVAYLALNLDPARYIWDFITPDGTVRIREAESFGITLTITDAALATHLGLSISESEPAGEILGVKVPGWWTCPISRPWGYTLQVERSKVASPQGAVLHGRDQGRESDTLGLWTSLEAVGEVEEAYRLVLWALDDSRVLTLETGERLMIGNQSTFVSMVDVFPLSLMELEVIDAAQG